MPLPEDIVDKPLDDGLVRVWIHKPDRDHSTGAGYAALIISMVIAQLATRGATNRGGPIVSIVMGMLTFFVAAYGLYASIRHKRIRAMASLQRSAPTTTLAEKLFDGVNRPDVRYRSRVFVMDLLKRGRVNESYAMCRHDEIKEVHAATTPFEPRLIENVDSFVNAEPQESADADSAGPLPISEGGSRRVVTFVGFASIASAGIWVIAKLAQLQWLNGIVHPMSVTVIVGLTWWGLRAFFRRDQWLLVPGGVVLRKGRLLSPGVQLNLYDRRTSVACVVEMDFQRWMLTLAQTHSVAQRVVIEYQLERFLQAWLSPLIPPVDRWVDLELP